MMYKYLIFIFFLYSTNSLSAQMIKETITIAEYYSKYNEELSKYMCDINTHNMAAYALIRASFSLERKDESENLIRELLTKDSVERIDQKSLEMRRFENGEQQLVCIDDKSAIVLRSVIDKAKDKSYATGWLVVIKYSFSTQNGVPKISIVEDKHSKDMYSLSEVIKAQFFTKIVFPYSTFEVIDKMENKK